MPHQKSAFTDLFRPGAVRLRLAGLLAFFQTFFPPIFFPLPLSLSLAPTNYPWDSEDGAREGIREGRGLARPFLIPEGQEGCQFT